MCHIEGGTKAPGPSSRPDAARAETPGMTTLSARGTGGTDHTRFDEVGLPGFQLIQDSINTTRARITPTWMFTSGFRRRT